MIVIDPNSSRRYVLRDERSKPVEEQSVFLLRPLTLAQETALKDSVAAVDAGNSVSIRQGTQELKALQYGLEGWENVRDSKGNEVPFKATTRKVNGKDVSQVDDATLAMIPPKYRAELAEEITNGSGLSGDEAKN